MLVEASPTRGREGEGFAPGRTSGLGVEEGLGEGTEEVAGGAGGCLGFRCSDWLAGGKCNGYTECCPVNWGDRG